MTYTGTHFIAILGSVLIALALIAGMLFGNHPLSAIIPTSQLTIQKACIAIWGIVVPAWFTIEEYWAPDSPKELAAFRKNQQLARSIWLVAASIIGVIIGTSIK